MKQKLILLTLVMGLTIVSQSSMSLGMGKIQVYSALNEPLQSSIDLLANADEELLNLEVKLASREDYLKVGLDKSFVPANIMVAFDAENPNQINVTSNGPVTEPIVSLLLDVNWNNGRILREFTVLLDPPVYETSNTTAQVNNKAQVNKVVVESIQEAAITESDDVMQTTEESPADPPAFDESITYTNEDMAVYDDTDTTESTDSSDSAATETIDYSGMASSVNVEAGDTLWRIANDNKVGSLSAQQMMMAIYDKNPSAFIDNNINQLIKGSRLDMPSVDEATNIGFTEAMAQVQSHHQSWSPAQQDYNTYQTEESVEVEDQESESTLDYGVQLTGGDNDGSDDGQSNSDQGTAADAQAIEEDLYNKDAENNDLKERISELEDIVDQQQDVIEVNDDGLANLESQLENAAEETTAETDDIWDEGDDTVDADALTLDVDAVDETNADAVDSNEVDDMVSIDAADNGDDEEASDEDSLQIGDFDTNDEILTDDSMNEVSDETDSVVATPVKSTNVTAPAKQQSFVDNAINWVMANLMWVLIGLVALVVLLFIPKMLSSSDDTDDDETSFLDDIKNRNKLAEEEESIDETETKLNEPLVDIDDSDNEDVLADLDRRIDFDDKDNKPDVNTNVDDDELTELSETGEFETIEDDGGFDLDGFLNDDDKSDITDTKDHSETLAAVSFDTDDDEDDLSFDDLDLDDEIEDFSDDVDAAAEDLKENVQDKVDEVIEEKSDEVNETETEFSFDNDDEFDFDLDEELDELTEDEEEDGEIEIVDTDIDEDNDSEDFNDMLDISDEDSETFEIIEEEDDDSMDEEIDLGLEDLMDDADAIGTKLDLAKAYIDMGDSEGAKNLLDEVFAEGTEEQIAEAKKLLDDM